MTFIATKTHVPNSLAVDLVREMLQLEQPFIKKRILAQKLGCHPSTLYVWIDWLCTYNEQFFMDWREKGPSSLFQVWLLAQVADFWKRCKGMPIEFQQQQVQLNLSHVSVADFKAEFGLIDDTNS